MFGMTTLPLKNLGSKHAEGFDPYKIREDFPIFKRRLHDGKKLAYLDNAATTQKPDVVIRAVQEYYSGYNANVHRAIHQLAAEATESYEAARSKVAAFIHAPQDQCIVFTKGTTESINLVAHAWGKKFLQRGDVVLLTEMEHHSNLVPWQLLAQQLELSLDFVPVQADGTLNLEVFKERLIPQVKLVGLTQMSNVLGTINPVREIVSEAHEVGAKVLVDAAQSVAHMAVDVQDLGCDFLAFSSHKMCGPTGLGVLYARRELLEEMDPFLGGGDMILKVDYRTATWNEVPYKFEAGTPHVAGAVAFLTALEYLERLGMDQVLRAEQLLMSYALERLKEVPGLHVFGDAKDRGGILAFSLEGLHPHDVAQFVDRDGVAIRAGHHCAQPLMRRLGVPATSRVSFYLYNVKEEVDQLTKSLLAAKEFFSHGR